MSDEKPSSRSVQVMRKGDKYVMIKKKPLKSEIKKRLYITDSRRTYAQMVLNTFNGCDVDELKAMLEKYCTEDLTSVSIYEGENHTLGPNCSETKTIPGHITYWSSLFKSAPDLVFESEFLTAYIDPVANVTLVKCKFTMNATRVVDVKLPKKEIVNSRKKRNAKNKQVRMLLFTKIASLFWYSFFIF